LNLGETGLACTIDDIGAGPLVACYNATITKSGTYGHWTMAFGTLLNTGNVTGDANRTTANIHMT